MMKHKNTISILLVIFLAFIIRFHKIDHIPPSLSWDEVSIGYNAYSIIKTLRDEHGRFLPLDSFTAYGDYKPPIPIYVTIPFIVLFGLNEFSVRLPYAIIGTVTVGLTYLLVYFLFENYRRKHALAFIASAVLAVSPWHVNLSRAAFEAVIGLFFIVLTAIVFLLAMREKRYWYGGFLPIVGAIYTFNSARYFAPLFMCLLLWYTKESVKRSIRQVVIGMLIAVVALVPIFPHLLSPEARLRYKEVNIFSDIELVNLANQRIERAGNTIIARIIHNRRIYYTLSFAKHYLDHFEPRFLFVKGDGNPKFSIQDVGQLHVVEIPLLLIGFFYLLIKKRRVGIFLFLWLLLAIIPAGVARETPHALRILNTLPTWHIFIAFGIMVVLFEVKNRLIKNLSRVYVFGGYVFCIIFYLHNYYVHYPIEYSGEWQYGYREAFQYAESVKDSYRKIVVTDFIGRPYAYALFYGRYDPHEFWETKESFFDAAGFYNVKSFGKYDFVRTNPVSYERDVLYILPADSALKEGVEVFRIHRLNGDPVLIGFHL